LEPTDTAGTDERGVHAIGVRAQIALREHNPAARFPLPSGRLCPIIEYALIMARGGHCQCLLVMVLRIMRFVWALGCSGSVVTRAPPGVLRPMPFWADGWTSARRGSGQYFFLRSKILSYSWLWGKHGLRPFSSSPFAFLLVACWCFHDNCAVDWFRRASDLLLGDFSQFSTHASGQEALETFSCKKIVKVRNWRAAIDLCHSSDLL